MKFRLPSSSVINNLLASVGLQLTIAALSLISGPLQARGLGSDGRGQLAVVLVIGQIASMAVDMGTGGYLIRERANGLPRNILIGSITPIVRLSVVGCILLAWPIAYIFCRGDTLLEIMIVAQLALMPIVVCTQIATSLALGEEDIRSVVIIRLTTAIVPVIGLTVLFIVGKITLITASACYFLAILVAIIPTMKIWAKSLPLAYDAQVRDKAWKFGRSSMLTMILSLGNVRADALIVARALSFHDAGLYVVASTLAGLPMMLANASMQSLARRLSLDGLGRATAQASGLVSAAVMVSALIVAISSPFILPLLFGKAFAQSVPIAWILLAGATFGANANFLGIATTLANEPKIAAYAQLAGIATMVVSMLILSSFGGILGAATGSALGYVVTSIYLIRHAKKTSKFSWYAYVIPSSHSILTTIRHIKGQ